MNILVVGTNHKYSTVGMREKFFFNKGSLPGVYRDILNYGSIRGVVVLSTCNRTEIYADVDDIEKGLDEIYEFFSTYSGIERGILVRHFYVHKMKSAVKHLCGVCSGLDSMVVGELQIRNQVKEALAGAIKEKAADAVIMGTVRNALRITRKVHAETGISEGKMSVGSVAVDFIKQKTGELKGKSILIIGAGKVTALLLKYLGSLDASIVFVANRTFERAKDIAGEVNALAVRFDKLKEYLDETDIVITATASPHFIIKNGTIAQRKKPLYIFDLGMPRDVEPQVADFEDINLFTIEDLREIIAKNAAMKEKRAVKAREIISGETDKIWRKHISSAREPVLWP
jgi:glutamyl-tRNA reductase